MKRLLLQIVNGSIGFATVALALMTLLFGVDSPVYRGAEIPPIPALDSNLRFFGGMALGLGAILLWITPAIELHTRLFRAVWLCALAGGIGRLISMAVVGTPPLPMIIFTSIEVPLVPILLWWQTRVAREAS